MTESKKKRYESPIAEKIEFDYTAVMACSTSDPTRPGHGYGDKNHQHEHWKDNGYYEHGRY